MSTLQGEFSGSCIDVVHEDLLFEFRQTSVNRLDGGIGGQPCGGGGVVGPGLNGAVDFGAELGGGRAAFDSAEQSFFAPEHRVRHFIEPLQALAQFAANQQFRLFHQQARMLCRQYAGTLLLPSLCPSPGSQMIP